MCKRFRRRCFTREIETMIEMADRHKLNAVNLEDFLALMR
jgi:hypothetical protein